MSSEKTLKVMTYNVHAFKDSNGNSNWDRVIRRIRDANADVVGLQEFCCRKKNEAKALWVHRMAEQLNMHGFPAELYSIRSSVMGNVILSRYPIRSFSHQDLQRNNRGRYYEPRGAQWAFIEWNGIELGIINIHLSCWPHERTRQANHFFEHAPYDLERGNWIFLGDFNALPKSRLYQKIIHKYKFRNGEKKSLDIIKTWPSVYPMIQIDHIFYKGKMNMRRIECIKGRPASDHLPVVAEFIHES